MSTRALNLTLLHTDSDSSKIDLGDITATNSEVKTAIRAINTALTNNPQNDFAKAFVSSTGAQTTKISEARIVTTEEEVIYNG